MPWDPLLETPSSKSYAVCPSTPDIARRVRAGKFERLLALLAGAARETPPPSVEDIFPDPNDNPILAIDVAGGANLIVSGDKREMTALDDIRGVPILTATEALRRLAGLFVDDEE